MNGRGIVIKLNIEPIDNKSLPIYRRVADALEKDIQSGRIPSGTKLPTVRKLSSQLYISPGTALRTYEYLSDRGLISMQQGKGTFVLEPEYKSADSKEQAIILIDSLIHNLEKMHFSQKEIETYFDLVLRERQSKTIHVRLGVVDCNPEALHNIHSQLNRLEQVHITTFLLHELDSSTVPYDTHLDLVTTTSTHFEELSKKTTNSLQILPISLAPSSDTIVNLSKIKKDSKVGICTQSARFGKIVENIFKQFAQAEVPDIYLFESQKSLKSFCKDKEVIIVPYEYESFCSPKETSFLQEFQKNNGELLEFNYQVDKGSLLHITKAIESCHQQLLDRLVDTIL